MTPRTRREQRPAAAAAAPAPKWEKVWPRLVKQGWRRVRGAGLEPWRFVLPQAAKRLLPGKHPRLQIGCDYFISPEDVLSHCKRKGLLPPLLLLAADEDEEDEDEETPPPPARKKKRKAPEEEPAAKKRKQKKLEKKPLPPLPPLVRPTHNRNTRQSTGPLMSPKRNSPSFALFGFNCTSSSDVVRMRAVLDLYRVRVTSASEQDAPSSTPAVAPFPTHYSCDFKQSVLCGVDTDTVVLMLDYFWLQGNWWYERYGQNWISAPRTGDCKLVRAFQLCSKLQVCVVPLDRDGFMQSRAKAHRREFAEQAGLDMECITWKQAQAWHPLCLATELAKTRYLRREEERRAFDAHVRYVTREDKTKEEDEDEQVYSFVVIHRTGVGWRKLLAGYRV